MPHFQLTMLFLTRNLAVIALQNDCENLGSRPVTAPFKTQFRKPRFRSWKSSLALCRYWNSDDSMDIRRSVIQQTGNLFQLGVTFEFV